MSDNDSDAIDHEQLFSTLEELCELGKAAKTLARVQEILYGGVTPQTAAQIKLIRDMLDAGADALTDALLPLQADDNETVH